MSVIVPLTPISGLLAPYVNVDLPVATLLSGGTLKGVFLTTLEAPGVGGIHASVGTQAGGYLSAVIPEGGQSIRADGVVSVVYGATLNLRITAAAAGAGWLSGWIEFDEDAIVVPMLTTLALVRQHAGISSNGFDPILGGLIQSVSVAMQNKMKRQIVSMSITDERHNSIGASEISLEHWPVLSSPAPVVREGGVALGAGDFEVDFPSGIVHRKLSSVPIGWALGRRNVGVDYRAGYEFVPLDLSLAATKQVRHEFAQTNPSGSDRLGKRDVGTPGGGTQTFDPDGWLPSVLVAMAPYTRK